MNKGMIMLGIILLAGLSFAAAIHWEYPWQGAVSHNYGCSLFDESYYHYQMAYAYMYAYAGPSDLTNMYYAFNQMNYFRSRMASPYYDYYATIFKSDMLSYNGQNSLFNGIFNSVLRAYMAHADSGARANILALLQGYNGLYRTCISPIG